MPHQRDLYSRWSREVRRSGLFRPGERVGVGVSGGPDSVLLLEFMRHLARETGLGLAVVHFNHHLRGAESDSDEEFVRALARDRELEFLGAGADVARMAQERRCNIEATARDLRYRFFFSLVDRGKVRKVATAHTANDQAETVLLKLLRGAGTRGLGGIYPVLEGKVVRPFLGLARSEIEQELQERKLKFRVDSSNRDLKLRRNKIRAELLPWLEREFNPRVVALLKDLADRSREDEASLEQQAREQAQPWRVREAGEERIPVRPLLDFPASIARRVLRQMIVAACAGQGGPRRLTHQHLEALRRFAAEAQSGRALVLPEGVVARKKFDFLVLEARRPEPAGGDFSLSVQVPGEIHVPQLATTFRFKIVSSGELRKAYNQPVRLDPLKVGGDLRLRNWRAGDCFRPAGSRKSLKLKELFRQQKVPPKRRRLWPVLESGKEIIWVRGFPPADTVVAPPEANEVLVIEEGPTESPR